MKEAKPIWSCKRESCDTCSIHSGVACHISFSGFLGFWLFLLPAFLCGGIVLYGISTYLFTFWIMLTGLFFLLAGIRVLCTHCPHYNNSSRFMKCHANYGFPKLWRYRPGPMNRTEKTVFLSGLFLVFGYPAFFILLSGSSGILIVYLVSAALFFILTGKFYCSRCIHFSCPLNRVKDDIKKEFMKYNHLTY